MLLPLLLLQTPGRRVKREENERVSENQKKRKEKSAKRVIVGQ